VVKDFPILKGSQLAAPLQRLLQKSHAAEKSVRDVM